MVSHYEKGERQSRDEAGYENFNLGGDGYFWRGVTNPANRNDLDAYACERVLFRQAAGAGNFTEVQVRAELPGTGLWAETTAKPVSLRVEPGTADAETHPASGACVISEDGSIGTPYAKGTSRTPPPCGITYRRATSGTPYPLKAAVTWAISWQGGGGTGGDLPDGTFETAQDITVQEIQSVNRRPRRGALRLRRCAESRTRARRPGLPTPAPCPAGP